MIGWSTGLRKVVTLYLFVAFCCIVLGFYMQALLSQSQDNENLILRQIHQQCLDYNVAAHAFNSQNPPPGYQRPYRICR